MGDEIELTLGLSLNGKFGAVDPIRKKTLKRSCSETKPCLESGWLGGGGGLERTCSMPADAEELEARRRKDLQMIRRRQAKRRLSEKLRSYGGADCEVAVEESLAGIVSQRSSGSSGLSTEVESHTTTPPYYGINGLAEAKSPQSMQSFSEANEHRPNTANPKAKPPRSMSSPAEMVKNVLADMPCVSTKGNGLNGKRVDGFLYRYNKKGDGVKIVCVCHGSFLTPAEFIKHAGGGDVEHPLRHIVVNPSPSL